MSERKMCKLCKEFYKKYPLEDCEEYAGQKAKLHIIERNKDDSPLVMLSPIQCAFENNVFSSDNWSCLTMTKLRELVGEDCYESKFPSSFYCRDDMHSGTLGVLWIPEPDDDNIQIQQGYLVMAWYKSRGTTSNAWIIKEGRDPKPLTLETAEYLIDYYSKEKNE